MSRPSFWRRLLALGLRVRAQTIWEPATLAALPRDFTSIYTTLFPLLYVLYVVYGVASLPSPILSIDLVFGPVYGDFWSLGLIAAGLAALLGQVIRPSFRRDPMVRRRIGGRDVLALRSVLARRGWRNVELVALSVVILLETIYQYVIFLSGFIGKEPGIRWLAILALVVYLGPAWWKWRDTVRKQRTLLP